MFSPKKIIIISGGTLLAAGLIISSCAFTSPALHINSQNVGLTTLTHAQEALQQSLQEHTITIGQTRIPANELGITYDESILHDALNQNRAWNITSWNQNETIPQHIDETILDSTLQKYFPDTYKPYINANVTYQDNTWIVDSGHAGVSIDQQALLASILDSLHEGETNTDFAFTEVQPVISDEQAHALADQLNTSMGSAGFYSGDHLLLSITPSQFSGLVKVTDDNETLGVSVDDAAARALVETLPEQVNQTVKNGSAVVDETGKRLKTIEPYQDGFVLTDDVDTIAKNLTESLQNVDGHVQLGGTFTPADVTPLFRRMEVNLTERRAYAYENDRLVKSYPVAIGKVGTPTNVGEFKIYVQLEKQNMGCSPRFDYCTPNVKWISYFNGDEGFHGTYWHNDFGNPNASRQSHGCVNMTEADALEVFRFAQVGTPVSVHW